MRPTDLSIQERSCILRAIHEQQKHMFSELERHSELAATGRVDAQVQRDAIKWELSCLHSAVKKIWTFESG